LPESGVLIQSGGGSIQEIGAADILVGIPTYNKADTIGPLVQAARSGVLQFPTYKTVIMSLFTRIVISRASTGSEPGAMGVNPPPTP
jgi:hypothetical protein